MNTLKQNIAVRALKSQFLDAALADEIFVGALSTSLVPFYQMLNVELTENNVPQSGKGIYKMYVLAVDGIENFRVFSGANDAKNLFFTPETNILYRTLHDIDHALYYKQGKGTTSKANELFLNCLMAKRAYRYAIKAGYTQAQAVMTFLCVYHDTVGQVHYYFENNDFCENQKALTLELLLTCKGMEYLRTGSVTAAKHYMLGLMNHCNVSTNDIF